VVLKRRNSRRRLWFGLGLAIALALFVGGLAFAAAPIVGQADNTFSATTYTIDQGEVSQLQVTGNSHNATARQNGPDGKALFRSATISGGSTGVIGTQYLGSGDYTFFCTIHPSTMQATLHVSGNGAPQARPSATVSVRSKKIAKASKKGILVAINSTAKVDGVSLTAKLGKATIGSIQGLALGPGEQFQVLKLSKSGKGKLGKKSKASVTVIADIPFGSPASGKKKLT
jgi:plastocyanin